MSSENPGLEQNTEGGLKQGWSVHSPHTAFFLGNRKLVVNYTALSAAAFPVDGMNSWSSEPPQARQMNLYLIKTPNIAGWHRIYGYPSKTVNKDIYLNTHGRTDDSRSLSLTFISQLVLALDGRTQQHAGNPKRALLKLLTAIAEREHSCPYWKETGKKNIKIKDDWL